MLEDVSSTRDALVVTGTGKTAFIRLSSLTESAAGFTDALTFLRAYRRNVDAFAMTPNGAWVVISNGDRWYSPNFPSAVRSAIDVFIQSGQRIAVIDFNAAGGWVVMTSNQESYGGTVPQSFKDKVAIYRQSGYRIEDADITNDGYVIIGTGTRVSWSLPGSHPLEQVLEDRAVSKRKVRQVDIGFDGRWVVVSDQEAATGGADGIIKYRLRTLAEVGNDISKVTFGRGDDFVLYSHGAVSPTPGNLAEALEYDVGGRTLWRAMSDVHIPGLSIALIENNHVTSVRGYGVLKADEQAPVLASTPYDLASLTKFVSSLTMLKLADEGLVNLNGDIRTNAGPLIAAWKSVGEYYPLAWNYGLPGTPLPPGITPSLLMRHRAGIEAHGSSPYAHPNNWDEFDDDSRTLHQLLGWSCSTSSACSFEREDWSWATSPPGGAPVYSNQNFLILMAIAEDATAKRGVELFEEKLFNPLALMNTSARIPLATSFERRAAWPHSVDGVPQAIRGLYPFVWPGGLLASAGDYAELMILALNQGVDSRGVARISAARINAMLNGVDDDWGFGLRFEGGNSALEGTDHSFRHTGSHSSRARTWMCGNPTRGEGIVVLTNRGDDVAGDEVIKQILATYVAQRGWPTGCR